MAADDSEGSARFISQLRSLRGSRPQPPAEERCELCSRPIPSQHSHVVHVEKRNLLCACRPCYLHLRQTGIFCFLNSIYLIIVAYQLFE